MLKRIRYRIAEAICGAFGHREDDDGIFRYCERCANPMGPSRV